MFFVHSIEHFVASNWYDSFIYSIANHAVRFSWTCLSVCEKTAMISFPSIIKNISTYFLVYLLLIGVFRTCWHNLAILFFLELVKRPKRKIECKFSFCLTIVSFKHSCWVLHIHNARATELLLSRVKRSHSNSNFNTHFLSFSYLYFGKINKF